MDDRQEIETLTAGWSAGTFDCVEDGVAYHFEEHGAGRTLLNYLREADAFPRDRAAMTLRSDGTLKFDHRDGRFLIVESDTQRILSYGRNER